MGDFLLAYKETSAAEGGYANVSGDNGGETYAGISRKSFPKWAGWKIVDTHKPLAHGQIIYDDNLESLKRSFYRDNFWDKVKGDLVDDHDLAKKIYDTAVLSGVEVAIKMAQRSADVPETGKMDANTLKALNV